MKEPHTEDMKLIQINGKFFKHKAMTNMSNDFIKLMILVDDDVAKGVQNYEVKGVVVIDNLVNVLTR